MSTVFISGSIKIKSLDEKIKSRLDKIIASELNILIGDASGVDKLTQEYLLLSNYSKVTVYCTGDAPRNNVGQWPTVNIAPPVKTKSRAYFTAKDLKMAETSDVGLMIWDCKSTGTLSNVIELLKRNRKSVVYLTPKQAFLNVSSISDLEQLILQMDESARLEADKKISLFKKIDSISATPPTTAGNIEIEILLRRVKEHQDAILKHQRFIADLQAQIDQKYAPVGDMFG
ncbi:hypothetical protein [Pseudomonas fluorescens]|uniref:hypothetical protein n=1 Tax=Pseudomonas fluorescens TaxID=294 RepID=UPI001253A1B4|nr:hypothetical protein [Pseudomonas fluorescens]VVP25234.1 hypothetical protein PS898_04040 [Pseudomonas fluorescens]